MRGTAEQILPTGEVLVRTGEGIVLVPNAVAGDILEIAVTDKRRGAMRGAIVTVITPSESRIEPACPVAATCGGCTLQFLHPDKHVELKSGWVRSAFQTCMDEQTEWLPANFSADRRRRVRWSIGEDEAGWFLGFQARASNQPVRQRTCMAVTGQLQQLHDALEQHPDLIRGLNSIQAIHLDDGMHVILEGEKPELEPPFADIAGLPLQWWWRHDDITRPLNRPVLNLHDSLPTSAGKLQVEVGPDDFIQGQAEGNTAMIRQVIEWAGDARRAADLFCGIGNLSLSLAASGVDIVGADVNDASIRAANRNAKRLGVPASYRQEDLFGRVDTSAYTGMDLIILDPPRKGARKVCELMNRMLPRKIIMVSCDPASGARDAATLQQYGYRLRALRALDLFPYAGHVEAMSLWSL